MKKVVQKQDRPNAMSHASRKRGCLRKRRTFASALNFCRLPAGSV